MKTKKYLIFFILFIILGIILLLFFIFRKSPSLIIDSTILSFSYSFSSDGGVATYEIEPVGSEYNMQEKYIKGSSEKTKVEKIDSVDFLEKLKDIINKYEMNAWDGFNKSENGSTNETFSLRIKYADGHIIQASGKSKFPKNYEKASQELKDLLSSVIPIYGEDS